MNRKIYIPLLASIAVLLALVAGAFAYFTTQIEGNETISILKTYSTGNVSYETTSPADEEDVLPGWTGDGMTKVYLVANSLYPIDYYCTVALDDDSVAENVYVQTIGGDDGQVPYETLLTNTGVIISAGTIEPEEIVEGRGTEHVVNYRLIYKEIGNNQSSEQGQVIKTFTTCFLDQEQIGHSSNEIAKNEVTVVCDNCSANTYSQTVLYSLDTSFKVFPNAGYDTLSVVGEGCNLSGNTLTVSNVTSPITCRVYADRAGDIRVSLICNGCSADSLSKNVVSGADATFNVDADLYYTLDGAVASNGCTLENGVLTVSNVTSNKVCTIDAVEVQTETVSGTLTDVNGNPLANQAVVAFSKPKYFVTDSDGHYEVTLESGEDHTFYYIPGLRLAELQSKGTGIQSNANAYVAEVSLSSAENVQFTETIAEKYAVSVDLSSSIDTKTQNFITKYYNKFSNGQYISDNVSGDFINDEFEFNTIYTAIGSVEGPVSSITINGSEYDSAYRWMSIGMNAWIYMRTFVVDNNTLYIALPYLIAETLPGTHNVITASDGSTFAVKLYDSSVESLTLHGVVTSKPVTGGTNSATYSYNSNTNEYVVTQTSTNQQHYIGLVLKSGNTILNNAQTVAFRLTPSNKSMGLTAVENVTGTLYTDGGNTSEAVTSYGTNYSVYINGWGTADYTDDTAGTTSAHYKIAIPGYGTFNANLVLNAVKPS